MLAIFKGKLNDYFNSFKIGNKVMDTKFDTEAIKNLIEDITETMYSQNRAGIAAPQIGIDKKIAIFAVNKNLRYPRAEEIALTILINPIITYSTDEIDCMWKGCLNVPKMRGLISRINHIKCEYQD